MAKPGRPSVNREGRTSLDVLAAAWLAQGCATMLTAAFQDEYPVVAVTWVARRIALANPVAALPLGSHVPFADRTR